MPVGWKRPRIGSILIGGACAALAVTGCSSSGGADDETIGTSQNPQDAPLGAEAEPCGPGEETYVGSGLFAWLPAAVELEVGSTDDPPPHAEAGATFTVDGEDVEIWRSLQYGPDEVPSATGRADHGAAVFVRTNDPARQDCVLAGLRYDPEEHP